MPPKSDEYNISTQADARAYVANAIEELRMCKEPDDIYTYALIAFTVCDIYFHWLISDHRVLADIRRELGAFRTATHAREMRMYADFEHLINRINAILPVSAPTPTPVSALTPAQEPAPSREKFAAVPPPMLRPRPASPRAVPRPISAKRVPIYPPHIDTPRPILDDARPAVAGACQCVGARAGARAGSARTDRPDTAGPRRVPTILEPKILEPKILNQTITLRSMRGPVGSQPPHILK